jgi:hydroxyethylthiazole kinase-like uncharacterized protein yjeF
MNLTTALLDVSQMSEADRLTVAAGIPVTTLMDNAGAAVAHEIKERWSARPVTVLCGPGNNGGDGFVTARLLAESGWQVRVVLLGSQEKLTGAARYHAALWLCEIEPLSLAVLDGAELIVDAIFGAGLSRPLEGVAAETLTAAAFRKIPIVAIDVPTGLMGDTGEAFGAVAAALTVTFFRKKPGHVLLPGRSLCGEVIVADIGTPISILDQLAPNTFENCPEIWVSALPQKAVEFEHWLNNPLSHDQVVTDPRIVTLNDEEFSRHFDLTGDKLTRTRAAARLSNAIILLRGTDTIIAAPNGMAIINTNEPEILTPAWAGDALSSILLGLLDQGMDPFLAAAAAVWLHGAVATGFVHDQNNEDLADFLSGLLRSQLVSRK